MTFKYFGTDGIRGRANEDLTPEIAFKVGRYLGYKLNSGNSKFVIGRDTRQSGLMLEAALSAGLMASGVSVDLLGVVVTPMVAYILKNNDYVGGIMISASHNPYYDNGLKVMNADGFKIDDFLQTEVEQYIDGELEIPLMLDDKIGVSTNAHHLVEDYYNYLQSTIDVDLKGLKIAVDTANGSTSQLVEVFDRYNLESDIIHNQPNGVNINEQCGSTKIKVLQAYMSDKVYDLGVSFDGDGDRLMIIDEHNNIIDGDAIMYILANYYKENNLLKDNAIVVTVMSNLGLLKALDAKGIQYFITDVGDKNVFEKIQNDDLLIGGEQSGHVILKNHSNMGDGILVVLKIMQVMKHTQKSLSTLLEGFITYPQLMKNHPTKDKHALLENNELLEKIAEYEKELHGNGRILVRPSGTEPLVRVMVEAESEALCEHYVNTIIELINKIEE